MKSIRSPLLVAVISAALAAHLAGVRGGRAEDNYRSLFEPPGNPTTLRKPLPPIDCWHGCGPAPCGPCQSSHRGFLYYGTYPWDDDPVNGFDDCCGGDCGRIGASMSVHWIRMHDRLPRLLPVRSPDACCPPGSR